jgi:hypothetical protein
MYTMSMPIQNNHCRSSHHVHHIIQPMHYFHILLFSTFLGLMSALVLPRTRLVDVNYHIVSNPLLITMPKKKRGDGRERHGRAKTYQSKR